MIRSKLGVLTFCIVMLGVMAIFAGLAQASSFVKLVLDKDNTLLEIVEAGTSTWLILNSSGTTATELKALLVGEKDSEDLTVVTHLLGRLFWVTCTNFELVGVNLEKEGKLTTGSKIVFTGCEAYGKGPLTEPLNCKLHSTGKAAGTIETNKLKGELVLHKGESKLLMKIEPEVAGGTLKTFLTEECVMPESNSLKGRLYLEDSLEQITTHAVKHLLVQNPLTFLYVGTDTVEHLETSLNGSVWVKLGAAHTGLKWSAMDP
jgi:hypothetical protein